MSEQQKTSEYEKRIPRGVYRHFKGNLYRVVGIAFDCDDLHEVVVYEALYGEGRMWVRDAEEFLGYVVRDGEKIKRFELCKDTCTE